MTRQEASATCAAERRSQPPPVPEGGCAIVENQDLTPNGLSQGRGGFQSGEWTRYGLFAAIRFKENGETVIT